MASNSSCHPVLSCEDSPLSTTGNLIGILTFAYAIIITVLYRTQELGNANQDIRRIAREISREFLWLQSTANWIKDLLKDDDLSIQIGESIMEARVVFEESEELLGPSAAQEPRKWKLMIERGRFLSRKTEIQEHLDDILRIRSNLETLSQGLANRIMLEQVQRQSETSQIYQTSIRNQDAMLRRVMNALHLQAMEEPSEEDSVPQYSPGELEMNDVDIIRPPSQWDPPGRQNSDA